jgi:aspartate/methionine/tyrosine aminotransferase
VFSSRLAWGRPENALARLERERRAAGAPLIDLTESNPTRVGLPYPADELRAALAPAETVRYQPAPRGRPEARAAIAAGYAARGVTVDADRIVLSASSSESYAWLFKLLCDPGDAVLVPEPSYPLFEYLARLEGVVPVPYRLAYDGAWHLDGASIAAALARAAAGGQRPRALIAVSPNNPTGSFLKRFELEPLARACEAAELAVLCDEVFADYGVGDDPARVPLLAAEEAFTARVPTFSLGGLSKSCGLPQIKVGWIVAGGPPDRTAAALGRLELIADTYLSVATPAELALPRLLEIGREVRRAIAERVAGNRRALASALPASAPCTLLPAEGGWSAILRVPATQTDEAWAAQLLVEEGVLAHPGYFFDLEGGAFLVLSLLAEPAAFTEGARRLVARCCEGR